MKKLVLCLIGVIMSVSVFSQTNTTPKFISKILPPIPVLMSESATLKISYITGSLDNKNAFSLVFENKSDQPIFFGWTLVDNNGKTVGEQLLMNIPAHSTIDYTNVEYGSGLIFEITDSIDPARCTFQLSF